MSIEQMSVNAIVNPEDQKKLLSVIKNCSDSLVRIAAERDFMKEEIKEISKQLEIPKRLITKMVKVYYKQNYDEEVAVQDQFQTLYESIVK